MGWSGKEAFLLSKTQTSEFYFPLVSQIPKRHGPQELLRLFLNKLNFPALPVSTVPWSTEASVTKEEEHRMTVHGRGAQLGWRFGDAPDLNGKKAQGWCPREQRLWGGLSHPAPTWKSPSLHQCPQFDWVSVKILGSRRSQETPAIKFLASLYLLNHLPGGCFLLLCSTNASNH